MLSHSVFLGTGESHLLVLFSALGIEKLLSWMKCLCLVCLTSFTKWVSEACAGLKKKKLIFSAFMLFTFVWFPLRGTGEDITNYLCHPQLAAPSCDTCQMGFVFCFTAFLLVTFILFLSRKFDSWYYHATVYLMKSRSEARIRWEKKQNTITNVFPDPSGLSKISEKCSSW